MANLNQCGRDLRGVVTRHLMSKTATVLVTRSVKHKCYGKIIKKHKKYYAHDESNLSSLGDIVIITESRPISKTKKWRIKNVVVKSN